VDETLHPRFDAVVAQFGNPLKRYVHFLQPCSDIDAREMCFQMGGNTSIEEEKKAISTTVNSPAHLYQSHRALAIRIWSIMRKWSLAEHVLLHTTAMQFNGQSTCVTLARWNNYLVEEDDEDDSSHQTFGPWIASHCIFAWCSASRTEQGGHGARWWQLFGLFLQMSMDLDVSDSLTTRRRQNPHGLNDNRMNGRLFVDATRSHALKLLWNKFWDPIPSQPGLKLVYDTETEEQLMKKSQTLIPPLAVYAQGILRLKHKHEGETLENLAVGMLLNEECYFSMDLPTRTYGRRLRDTSVEASIEHETSNEHNRDNEQKTQNQDNNAFDPGATATHDIFADD
jgi:hypothetical protein